MRSSNKAARNKTNTTITTAKVYLTEEVLKYAETQRHKHKQKHRS